MLSSRTFATTASMLRARPAAARMFSSTRSLKLQPTARMTTPLPKEEQSAHTISQRIRSAGKNIPVEIYPLIAIMSLSLSFGIYSFIRPAIQDATLRLHREGGRHHD